MFLALSMARSRCLIVFISPYSLLSTLILLADLILSSYPATLFLFYLGSLDYLNYLLL